VKRFINWLKKKYQETPTTDSHPVRCEALIVEDKQDESDFLVSLLRVQGVVTTVARNIGGAVELIRGSTRFHLAFVDLNLPDGSGIEVVRSIVESRRMTHVIVVSGSIEKIPLVMSYGYVGLLGKPYTTDSIRRILWVHRLPCSD
jgi:two-component system response regulator PilR (NtrC family)